MPSVKYSPYIPNVESWIEYFKNQPKEYKSFYTIGRPKHRGEDMDPIKLVSPTEQAVEQAKSRMKRKREEEDDKSFDEWKTNYNQKKKNKRAIGKSSDKGKKK